MILVAAVACGFALRREADSTSVCEYQYPPNWLGDITYEPLTVTLPFLMMLTPAVLMMRLRRPRPRWRKLTRQPGMTACCAAVVPIVVTLIGFTCVGWGRKPGSARFADWEWGFGLFWDCGFHAGLWTLAAWLTLALSGRRRSERSGIDRFGRLVGVGWLVVLAIQVLGRFR